MFLRESVRPYGPTNLNWLDDKTVALFSPEARSRLGEGETRQAGIRGRLENLPPAEPAAPLGTSGSIARDLILKSHLNNEVRSDAPYPELPPIYLTKPPQSEGGGGQKASLISPTADLTSLTRKKDDLVNPSRWLLLGDA